MGLRPYRVNYIEKQSTKDCLVINRLILKMSCTTIIVPKPTFTCPHCSRIYRRKREYELHKSTCRIIEEEIHEKEIEIRQDNMTHQQLCDIVKLLVREQDKLKEQVKTLKTQLSTIRKKVSVEEYLSQNVKPVDELEVFSRKLSINMETFIELLSEPLEKTLENVVLSATPVLDDIPLRTFTGHTGTIYCFTNQQWRRMTEQDWRMISGGVIQSVMDRLKEWTDANESRLNEDAFSLRYNTYVQKIMNCITRIQPKLIAILCQRVRVSLNNITTFEFTFA
jgi:hypothetical protein